MANQYDSEDNLEVYTPTLGESESINLDETTTGYSSRLNRLREGDKIEVKLNEEVIKWRIAHDLYKDYRSGVRELFNNEARACRQARNKYNAKPKIVVTINGGDRRLSIQGVDSLGISEAVFDKVLRVLGVSGNTDGGEEVGQFGMGFASYVTLSNVVIVETWYRENRKEDDSEQRYAFMGDKGIDFKILPEPELDTYGTKLSLTFNNNCRIDSMIETVRDCARLCGIPTELVIEDDYDVYHTYGKQGIYELTQYKDIKDYCRKTFNEGLVYNDMYTKEGERTSKGTDIQYYKEVSISNDDYEFFGIIGIMGSDASWFNVLRTRKYLHLLCNVPIDMQFAYVGEWSVAVLNIKNERKFMPTADRDRLTEEATQQIQEMYNVEIKKHFKGMGVSTIKEYSTSLHKPFLECFGEFDNLLDESESEKTREILSTLNVHFQTTKSYVKLSSLLSTNRPAIAMKSLRGEYMQRLSRVFKEPIFFRFNAKQFGRHGNEERCEAVRELLKETDIIFGEDYIKEHKLKPLTRGDRVKNDKVVYADKPIRIFNSGYRRHHRDEGDEALLGHSTGYGKSYISTTIGKVNDNIHEYMLIVPKSEFNTVQGYLWRTETKYVLMKPINGLDKEKITEWSGFIKGMDDMDIVFIGGKVKKLKSMIKKDVHYKIAFGKKEEAENIMKGHEIPEGYKTVIYVEDRDALFKLYCYFGHHAVNCSDLSSNEMERILTSMVDVDIYLYCNDQQKKIIYGLLGGLQGELDEDLFILTCRAIEQKPYEAHDLAVFARKVQGKIK